MPPDLIGIGPTVDRHSVDPQELAAGLERCRREPLVVARHRVRHVQLVEASDLGWRELELLGGEGILEVRDLGRSDDGRRHAGPLSSHASATWRPGRPDPQPPR